MNSKVYFYYTYQLNKKTEAEWSLMGEEESRTNSVGSRLRLFGWEETGTSLGEEVDTDHPLSNFETGLMPRIVGQEVRVAQMQNAE